MTFPASSSEGDDPRLLRGDRGARWWARAGLFAWIVAGSRSPGAVAAEERPAAGA